ncbi:MAG: ATP-binding protein [Mariprofundus sp.]|nr:ATP-binding protein [Mariprofundus sp.]
MRLLDTDRSSKVAAVLPGNMGRVLLMRAVLILCQLLLVLLSLLYDGITLSLAPIMAVITIYITVNVVSLLTLLGNRRPSERVYFFQLLLDVLFLTLLLYYSGGYTNPFVSLYLLPLIVVSTTMERRYAWTMSGVVMFCYTLMVFEYHPLFVMGGEHGSQFAGFHLHLLGMWFSFALSVSLIVFFIMRMTQSIRERDTRLAKMRETAERDSHILALGAMAAGAAHELGTPLATMAVVSHELACDFADNKEVAEQAAILKNELARCKQVLSQLSASAGQLRAEDGQGIAFDRFIRDAITHWQVMRPQAELRLNPQTEGSAPELVADFTLTQALYNLLNNAADAEARGILVSFGWDAQQLWLEVRDQGEGFPQYVLEQVGQPEISSKSTGHGLGLFLSRAVVERLGGRLQLFNPDGGGACARIVLPRG